MIGGFRYAVIDFETTVFESYKRKANPFDKRNKVIVSVFKLGTDTEVTTKYDRSGIDKFDDLPFDKFDVLVGQNMKFDLLYLWGSQRLREWLRNGGRIFDTMVAEYLLTGQQSMYASLDKLALKYGGEVKDNRLSEMFEAGIGADKIDPDILLPYAQGDILNTEIAFLGQLEALKRTAMTPLVWGYMDHLLALTEMEFNGMYFDLEAANTLREDLNKQYEDLRKRFQEVVDGYAKTPVVFNPDKPEHISALLYNTPIKVVTREQIGVFSDKCSKAGQPRYKVTREVVFLDMPNIHSAKGVREYKKKGVYASDNSILLTLKERCQGDTGATSILDGILKYREVKKLLTTYLYSVNLKTGKESGLIPLVNKLDGCIHGNLGMVGTVTGRLNSSNPNMQNIPTSLKKLFISRFGERGRIVEFDYSQLEVCNQAYVTQSPKMIQDIKDGVDFHVKRLAYAEETSYDKIKENLRRHPEVWVPKRRAAKIISFQKAYGAGIEKISEETGLSTATVERVFNEEDKEYPEVRLFGETVMEALKTSRVPTTTALPIRYKETGVYFEDQDEKMGIGFFQSITGKQYGFREWGVDSAKLREQGRPIFRYFKATQAANYPVQGLAADILALTVGRVFRFILVSEQYTTIRMINEVHDSLVLDVDLTDEFKDGIGPTMGDIRKIGTILEDVDGVFNEVLGIRFNVPIKVESVIGKQWGKEDDK